MLSDLAHTKVFNNSHSSEVTYELMAQDGSTFNTHRTHFYRNIIRNLLFLHIFANIIPPFNPLQPWH